MNNSYVGEFASLAVALCWAVSSTNFEVASRKVGSLIVNPIRLLLAFFMLGLYGYFSRGSFLPEGAGEQQWIWLSVSGLFGFFIGDMFLFESFTLLGARLSMLVMTFSPAITALIGYLMLDEKLTIFQVLAIFIIMTGIIMAFVGKEKGKFQFNMSVKGFLFAFGGALGQSFGYIFSKKGMGDYDPFAATQIRIITGFVCFSVLMTILRKWPSFGKALKDGSSMKRITIGSFFGPGLGVALSMFALTKTETGIASVLMALTPIFLIVPAFLKGRRIAPMELTGAFVAIAGVAILFL